MLKYNLFKSSVRVCIQSKRIIIVQILYTERSLNQKNSNTYLIILSKRFSVGQGNQVHIICVKIV